MWAFSATTFYKVSAVTLIFVFWLSKVVETIPMHQNMPNSHINIQLIYKLYINKAIRHILDL